MTARPLRTIFALCACALAVTGCALAPAGPNASADPVASATAPAPPRAGTPSPAVAASSGVSGKGTSAGSARPPAAASVDVDAYPWLADRTCSPQTFDAPLSARFAPPSGFTRADVAKGSFGDWLRGLPLRPRGPVVDHRGRVVLSEDDPRFSAVVALDEGKGDLQQCADSIVRLHAEWQWSRGARAISYRAASGTPMPFERWLSGDRPSADGLSLVWKPSGKTADRNDHSVFRRYLDAVFTWANTGALARDAAKTTLETLRPGDFFVLAGAPGHAVLVLDVAVGPNGRRAALLGQGYMPAQSFHVLRPSPDAEWFPLDPAADGVQTPFWPAPFPWSSLRRLDG